MGRGQGLGRAHPQFTTNPHIRGANGLSGIGALPIAEELVQLDAALTLLHGRELLLPPHPAIDIASTNTIIANAYPIFMTAGLPERADCEQHLSRSALNFTVNF